MWVLQNAPHAIIETLGRGEIPVKLVMLCVAVVTMLAVAPTGSASSTPSETTALCSGLFGSTFGEPSTEPLAPCQWDMSLIGASESRAWTSATGKRVTV